MLAAQLQRFAPFAELDDSGLARVAQHTRVLRLPAGRWLTRPGRTLSGSYYLLRGRVRTQRPDGEIADADRRARRPIVPGAQAIKTLAATQLLVVDQAAMLGLFDDQLLDDATDNVGMLLPQWLEPGWEQRFLRHGVVRPLGPRQWQRIFRAMQARACTAGERVVVQGRHGENFYVLSSGAASVCRGGREVARLGTGDFFGEEALVLRTMRNATVTMATAGSVMAISRDAFLTELFAKVVPRFCQHQPTVPVRVGRDTPAGSERVALSRLRAHAQGLDKSQCYLVLGDSPAVSLLGTFLLLQAGHRAVPDQDASRRYFCG
jgi:CRP-like cAMP-binding protein